MGLFSRLTTRSSRVTPGDDVATEKGAAAPRKPRRLLLGFGRRKGGANDENKAPNKQKQKPSGKRVAAAPAALATSASLDPLTLLLLGCDDAGKTSVACALKGEACGADGPTPTNGFDTAKVSRDGWELTLFDVGGGPKIRAIWPNYYSDAHAVLFVVDASAPERFADAAQLLREASDHPAVKGKPLLVLANKQDKPHACSGAELADALRLHELDGCGASTVSEARNPAISLLVNSPTLD